MQKAASKGKERELRFRDEMYMQTARRIFLEEGYHGLTLQHLADEVGFSKATVYQRFGCKEELMAELCAECGREFIEVMEKGAAFEGRPRERLMAMGESIHQYAQVYTENGRILAAISAETVLAKASRELQEKIHALDVQLFKLLNTPTIDAIAQGDLVLPPDTKPQAIAFALWTMVDGWMSAVRGEAPLDLLGEEDLFRFVLKNCHMLLDGYGWKPLSTEWDYDAVIEKTRDLIRAEIAGD